VTPLGRKLRRVLFLIPYVARNPDGVPLAELAALLDVTPRVLQREIDDLLTVGVPQGDPGEFLDLYIQGRGAAARVFVTRRLLKRPPRLTTAEAFALLLGASVLRRSGIASFDQALDRAEGKLRRLLEVSDSGPGQPPAVVIAGSGRERAGILAELSRASRARRTVQLDYASLAGQKRKKIEVEPYGLLNHRGGWYVLGKSLTHAEDRVFAFKVERILAIQTLDRPFTVPADFQLRKHAGDRLFIAGLAPVEIRLRLRGAAVRRMSGWLKNARLERGGTVVRFREVPTGWLAAWLLRQGPEVEVLSPPKLVAWVRTLAQRVADAHAPPEAVDPVHATLAP
jgi:proteasome accessory factor C